MTPVSLFRRGLLPAAVFTILLGGALASFWFVDGADHVDAPITAGDQAADIADIYSFQEGNNLVLAMTISNVQASPEIELGRSIFDPNVLYQFKIDSNGDAIEDLVIQAFVTGNVQNQVMHFRGPVAPEVTGTSARIVNGPTTSVRVSTGRDAIVKSKRGATVFAGVRDDPFFFDLGAFLGFLAGEGGFEPDPDGTDFFAGLNVYAIVIELPLADLGDPQSLTVWGTTHRL